MSELSFEQMFEESSFKRLRTGEAVTGQVIGVKEDEIILSIAGSKIRRHHHKKRIHQ